MKPFILFLFIALQQIKAQECDLDIGNDIKTESPLLLQPGSQTGIHAFYLPDISKKIKIPAGTNFKIACVSGKIKLAGTKQRYSERPITCLKGDQFTIDRVNYAFKDILCTPASERSIENRGSCLASHVDKGIGYKLARQFLAVIDVCFDDTFKTPIYSVSEIDKNIDTVVCSRPEFKESGQYNLPNKMDYYYNINNQRNTVNSILHLPLGDTSIIKNDQKSFSRGHLIAKSDLMYPSHQRCTFFYINTAPQWQDINGGSWSDIENDIRDLAINRKINLDVVAGTHGVLKLKDKGTGIDEEIYLYLDGKKKGLPVPEYFWKFVYEPISKAGVVIVSTNIDPILRAFTVLCTDVSSQLKTWITIDKNYGYACEYSDFKLKFGNIPNYNVAKLLT